jgi:hypothetical protein
VRRAPAQVSEKARKGSEVNKDQKLQQNRDKSTYGLRTFEQANQLREATKDSLAKAKDKTTKVKVYRRPSGLFDMLVFQPVKSEPKTEAKPEQK